MTKKTKAYIIIAVIIALLGGLIYLFVPPNKAIAFYFVLPVLAFIFGGAMSDAYRNRTPEEQAVYQLRAVAIITRNPKDITAYEAAYKKLHPNEVIETSPQPHASQKIVKIVRNTLILLSIVNLIISFIFYKNGDSLTALKVSTAALIMGTAAMLPQTLADNIVGKGRRAFIGFIVFLALLFIFGAVAVLAKYKYPG